VPDTADDHHRAGGRDQLAGAAHRLPGKGDAGPEPTCSPEIPVAG